MDNDLFTEPPWYADVAGIIYAVNGRPGQTTVATLLDGASAELLAAAPDLLYAVAASMECLEQEFARSPAGAHQIAVLNARNDAETAIARAKNGYPASTTRGRLWTVNPDLPDSERKANARLLDAAADLRDAATKVFAALSGHVDNTEIVGALSNAIVRATY